MKQHIYTEVMGSSGINRIDQKHMGLNRRRRVMPNNPDYLAAKEEDGTPRIKVAAYVAPKPKPDGKSLDISAAHQAALDNEERFYNANV